MSWLSWLIPDDLQINVEVPEKILDKRISEGSFKEIMERTTSSCFGSGRSKWDLLSLIKQLQDIVVVDATCKSFLQFSITANGNHIILIVLVLEDNWSIRVGVAEEKSSSQLDEFIEGRFHFAEGDSADLVLILQLDDDHSCFG